MALDAVHSECTKCGIDAAKYGTRGGHVCGNCFQGWIALKVFKSMERFRVMYHDKSVKNVLLPISFGYSSLSLLAILNDHLKNQRVRTGRVGYRLFVLHVIGVDSDDSPSSASARLQKLQELYPDNEYLAASFEDEVVQQAGGNPDEWQAAIPVEILSGLSASSHEDMMLLIQQRIITQYARKHSCSYVLHGDSMSRLSERILAETAKGRGFALPQIIGEAQTRDGLEHVYPLRDIFRKEVEEYAGASDADVFALVSDTEKRPQKARRISGTRNMTIDKLMAQYIPEMEETSSNVLANVLRTSAKLKQPNWQRSCSICGLLLDEDAYGLHGWGGDQGIEIRAPTSRNEVTEPKNMCYGCTRSLCSY